MIIKRKMLSIFAPVTAFILSLVVLIRNWNVAEQWRFNCSLAGFIIFAIILMAAVVGAVSKQTK